MERCRYHLSELGKWSDIHFVTYSVTTTKLLNINHLSKLFKQKYHTLITLFFNLCSTAVKLSADVTKTDCCSIS